MYDEILVPTDGTPSSGAALRHGIDLAQRYEARVHLVYVIDEGFRGRFRSMEAVEDLATALETAGEAALDAARDQVAAVSLPVETHVERGIPHRGIVEATRRIGADLVVMGTEQRSGACRNVIGSATERVVRMSPVPIHVVKTEPDGGPQLEIRPATTADAESLREIASRSMAASYGSLLSDETIEDAIEKWYGSEPASDLLSAPAAVVLIAELDGDPVAFSQAHLVETPAGTVGEIRWLHVDPHHRSTGIGTELLDRTRAALEDRGVARINALVLADYATGNAFYRDHDLDQIGTRPVRIGDRVYDEAVYARAVPADRTLEPQIEARTTAEGETVYLDYDDSEIGSANPFFAAYTNEALETRYGWYCSNCGTFDTAMDPMGRIVCNECGNHHKATRWDAVVTE